MKPAISKNILIVDDDKTFLESLTTGLGEEYPVVDGGEGKEAIDVVRKSAIDVARGDIKLLDIDGLEVLQEIKEINNKIGVILIFDKPNDIKNLKTRIKSLLKLRRDNTYNFREYPLDLENRIDRVKDCLRQIMVNINYTRSPMR
ncbi:MAG: response regulator [bacterium]